MSLAESILHKLNEDPDFFVMNHGGYVVVPESDPDPDVPPGRCVDLTAEEWAYLKELVEPRKWEDYVDESGYG